MTRLFSRCPLNAWTVHLPQPECNLGLFWDRSRSDQKQYVHNRDYADVAFNHTDQEITHDLAQQNHTEINRRLAVYSPCCLFTAFNFVREVQKLRVIQLGFLEEQIGVFLCFLKKIHHINISKFLYGIMNGIFQCRIITPTKDYYHHSYLQWYLKVC